MLLIPKFSDLRKLFKDGRKSDAVVGKFKARQGYIEEPCLKITSIIIIT